MKRSETEIKSGLNLAINLNINRRVSAGQIFRKGGVNMKKFTAFFCAATMALGMSASALAAPSIGELIPESPTLLSGEIRDGW